MPWLPTSLQGIEEPVRLAFRTLVRQLRLVPKAQGLPSGTGNFGVLAGTLPTGGFDSAQGDLELKMQVGFASGTTTAGGKVTVTFREAFPNGLICVIATRASGAGNTREIAIDTSAGQTDRTKVTFLYGDSAGALQASAAYLINWIAIGW